MSTILDPPVIGERPLYEVEHGVEMKLRPMGIFAGAIADRIFFLIQMFLVGHPIGIASREALFILDAENDLRRRPDVAYVSAQNWPLNRPLPEVGDWEVTPDLAVEVVSPHDVSRDVMAKTQEYFRCGVKQVWVVYPEQRLV